MKKKKQKKFSYLVPIYDIAIEVYLCKYEELPSYLKEDVDRLFSAFTTTVTENKTGERKLCIWIDDFAWTSRRMGTLVHELSHTVDKIDEIKQTEFNTEGRAYLLGYLVEHFFYKIGKIYTK